MPNIKISLRIKITFLVALLILVMMTCITYVFIIRELASRKAEIKVRMERIAQNIASIRSLETRDWEVYQGYINDLLVFNKDIVYIAIFDEAGELKAHALNFDWIDGVNEELDESLQARIITQLEQRLIAEESQRDFETVPVNIQLGEKNLGTVKVGFSLIDLNEAMRKNLFRNLQLSGIFLLLGILASVFLSQKLIKPLERLTKAMLNISKGDFQQWLNITSRDEIGDMARTFNFMTKGLQEKEFIEGFSRELGYTFELGKILMLIVERITKAVNSPKGALFLKQRELVLKKVAEFPGTGWEHQTIELASQYFCNLRRPFSLARYRENKELMSNFITTFDIKEMSLLIPLTSKDEVLGLLVLEPKLDGEPFSEEEEKFLSTLVGQATLAIENALLYEEVTEQERLKRELEIARQVQLKLLPQQNPNIPGLDIDGFCLPAWEVGGDYFDYFHLKDGKLGIAIADVTGKGASAAFYMAELKGMMVSLSAICKHPKQLFSELNKRLYQHVDRRVFATMIYAIIDTHSKEICFARAGHSSLLLKRGDRTRGEFLTPNGIGLGLEQGKIFDRVILEDRISLNDGDTLIFYTDGITEAMNRHREEFGEARLMQILERENQLSSMMLRQTIIQEVKNFAAGALVHDDMTMVIVKVNA